MRRQPACATAAAESTSVNSGTRGGGAGNRDRRCDAGESGGRALLGLDEGGAPSDREAGGRTMTTHLDAVNTAHYTYRVSWSVEDGEFVATCLELPSLSWLASTQVKAVRDPQARRRRLRGPGRQRRGSAGPTGRAALLWPLQYPHLTRSASRTHHPGCRPSHEAQSLRQRPTRARLSPRRWSARAHRRRPTFGSAPQFKPLFIEVSGPRESVCCPRHSFVTRVRRRPSLTKYLMHELYWSHAMRSTRDGAI